MKILIVEDTDEKFEEIQSLVFSIDADAIVERAANSAQVSSMADLEYFDLIVLDILLPHVEGGAAYNTGTELLKLIRRSKRNSRTEIVALTGHQDLSDALSADFGKFGVLIVEYYPGDESWKPTLSSFLRRAATFPRRQFLIVCALDVERDAFSETEGVLSPPEVDRGLDVCSFEIEGHKGCIVLLPRMGLVNATAVTAVATERYRPELVCMAGICAGVKGKAEIGQVIIADPTWEYQVGKFTPAGLAIEPYQLSLNDQVRPQLKQLTSRDEIVSALYQGIHVEKLTKTKPLIGPVASGSAVVADKDKMQEIVDQHRKLAGLEMEIFGVHRAAKLVSSDAIVFSAKSVVDDGTISKSDKYHKVASIISARFCAKAIPTLLKEI